jgi:hypothetical protein
VEEGKIVYPAGETRDFDGIKAAWMRKVIGDQ